MIKDDKDDLFKELYPKDTINVMINNAKLLIVDKYSKDNLFVIGWAGYKVYHQGDKDFSIKKFCDTILQNSYLNYELKFKHNFIRCQANTCYGTGIVDWCATGIINGVSNFPINQKRNLKTFIKKEDKDHITVFFIPEIKSDKRKCLLCSGTGLYFPANDYGNVSGCVSIINKLDKTRRMFDGIQFPEDARGTGTKCRT